MVFWYYPLIAVGGVMGMRYGLIPLIQANPDALSIWIKAWRLVLVTLGIETAV